MESNKLNIDQIIKDFIVLKDTKPRSETKISGEEIEILIQEAKKVFIKQPIFLEIVAPITICGILS